MTRSMLPPNTKYCQCAACGEYFTAEYGFNLHRFGGGCIPPDKVVDKSGRRKLQRDDNGRWRSTSQDDPWWDTSAQE